MRERKTGNIFGHNSICAQGEVLVALVELDRCVGINMEISADKVNAARQRIIARNGVVFAQRALT